MPKSSAPDLAGAPEFPKFNLAAKLVALEKRMFQTQSFALDQGNKLWRFHEGRYIPDGEHWIRTFVYDCFTTMESERIHWRPEHANRLVHAATYSPTTPRLWEAPPWTEINVKNGILKYMGGDRWQKHQSHASWLSPLQIAAEYDPTCTCPNWDQVIADILPQQDPEFLYKLIAWLICTAPNNNQQAVLFLGEHGGEGKSTLIKAICHLLGPSAAIVRSLDSLETNRFATADLQGKLALIDPDMSTQIFRSISVFKAIISQDPIQGEYKGGSIFTFTPHCKVLVGSNRNPASAEGGNAWERRWLTCPFDRILPLEKRLPPSEIHQLLTDPHELSGVLNRALRHIPTIATNGLVLTPEWKAMLEERGPSHDPLNHWLKSRLVPDPDGVVYKEQFYHEYQGWSEGQGRAAVSNEALGRRIIKLFPSVITSKPVNSKGARQPVWKGIRQKTKSSPRS